MNNLDLESDAIVLLRVVRAYLNLGVVNVHIDQTGVAITVATDEAAQRIIKPHGLRRAALSSLVPTWAGMIGDAPVSIRVHTDRPAA